MFLFLSFDEYSIIFLNLFDALTKRFHPTQVICDIYLQKQKNIVIFGGK